ncbi:MAG: hypothetical protein US57_C0015G0027 [Candidatus Moranbacteria bacterium GW2011_GWC2_37_73]|nr:MAG: hypothetical protein UR95_C0006G0027 [Parcubacteria group bacterium GW2011_GWC1_36_108]KKP99978.1 MAG: hypothetical protein US09_C0026G0023 [Candidatus Moranbacteria bacterium GW2011_GWD1_36_198]KKQ00079.1 MAG: hypothetical protein US10_C0042G0005 [Candidatus Moranbacteria bacterium GW2011_GWD2_36_198]KKQ39337.1 MAG: hypothetical protein US57_C0015G0027 [Candidatus Moranbacteria bacterium GW2011_GWC2_37_73]
MEKPSQRVIFGLIVALVALPSIGMAVSPTRNLLLGMLPWEATLTLADKIDTNKSEVDTQVQALQATVNSQQTLLDEQQRIKDEEQAKKETLEKQTAEQNIADEKESACEAAKNECIVKINKQKSIIDSAESYIEQRKKDTKSRKELLAKCGEGSMCSGYEDAIKTHEKLMEDKKDELNDEEDKLSKLENETCKDYKLAC